MNPQIPKSVSPYIARQIAYHASNYHEIPDFLFWYSSDIAEVFQEFILKKAVVSQDNGIIYNEKGLFTREVSPIIHRLSRFEKLNVFEIAEVTSDNTLPLLFELIENNKLGCYTPVCAQSRLNDLAISRVKDLREQFNFRPFSTDKITAEPELRDFKSEVVDIVKSHRLEDFGNIFVLASSRLGNSVTPQRLLNNIYNSMQEGDYFCTSQAIYNPGNETDLVYDYQSIIESQTNSEIDDYVDDLLIPSRKLHYTWNEADIQGVEVYAIAEQDGNLFGAEIKKGDKLTRFRSSRFYEMTFRKMVRQAGFRIIDIAYDANMDHALILAEK